MSEMKMNMKKIKNKSRIVSVLLTSVMCLNFVGCAEKQELHTKTGTAMGTVVNLQTYTSNKEMNQEIYDLITSLEEHTLSYRLTQSEVARINSQAGRDEGIAVSDKLYQDLITTFEVSGKSEGALDVTLGSVTKLWNIDNLAYGYNDKAPELPSAELLQQALPLTGYEKVTIKDGKVVLPQGMSLDLGAVGKGIACDRVYDYLKEKNPKGAVISIGGSIVVYGEKETDTLWKVGIADPFNTSYYSGIVEVGSGQFVSTSGDYERYFMLDGRKYHHIIDRKTGFPVDNELTSVTIVCNSGLLSDALSTACFVLGEEKGMLLADEYEAAVLFIDKDGNRTMNQAMEDIYIEEMTEINQ